MLQTWGIMPDAVIGHSLGEYSALCISGVISPSDALFLVGRRAQLLEEHLEPNTHAMLATALAPEQLSAAIREVHKTGRAQACELACPNGTNATVASGPIASIEALRDHPNGQTTRSRHPLFQLPQA